MVPCQFPCHLPLSLRFSSSSCTTGSLQMRRIISQRCSSSSWKSWRSASSSSLSPSSLSQILFLILYHRLPTGEENNKPALLKQLVEELEVSLIKFLVTFLSLSLADSLPHRVPQHRLCTGEENTIISQGCSSSSWKSWRSASPSSLSPSSLSLSLADSLPHPVPQAPYR